MGLIGYLLEWLRDEDGDAQVAEARADLGGDDVTTAVDYQPAGHDSQPLPGDFLLLVPGPEAGSYLVAGYLDPNNAGTAGPGESRLYARDGDGNIVCTIRLANDGNVHLGADTAEELIARADRVDAELQKIADTFDSITFTVDTSEGGGAPGQIGTPYSRSSTGCDRVYGV